MVILQAIIHRAVYTRTNIINLSPSTAERRSFVRTKHDQKRICKSIDGSDFQY